MMLTKTLRLMTVALLLAAISACSGGSDLGFGDQNTGDSILALPTRLATLDEGSLTAVLKIYEDGNVVDDVNLTITGGQVSSSDITLNIGHTYHFVIEFYYTSGGTTTAIAYAVLDNQTMSSGSTSLSFSASDIVYSQANISPSINASTNGFDVPDLDDDDDGVMNIDEIEEEDTSTTTSTTTATATEVDSDADGVADSTDNCTSTANASQADANDDGAGDACDDTDGDGVLDDADNCRLVSNATQTDVDADGGGDACDSSTYELTISGLNDGDTVQDTESVTATFTPLTSIDQLTMTSPTGFADTDADEGIYTASLDTTTLTEDSTVTISFSGTAADGTNVAASIAVYVDNNPNITTFTASESLITPGESVTLSWVVDNFDSLSLSTGVSGLAASGSQIVSPTERTTYTLTATRGTLTSTSSVTVDYDADSDGLGVDGDNCDTTANAGQADFNGDGEGDACDDTDSDGVLDATDNCVSTANTSQADFNSDGAGDACDDTDSDTVMDDTDNCVSTSNTSQADFNSDSQGDACDDTDSDTVMDDADNCRTTSNLSQADYNTDGAGDACDDTDGDACLDDVDAFREDATECTDTDSDTVGDNADNCDSTSNVSQADFNSDGQGDACDDTDTDGTFDDTDNCRELANADQTDFNSDGYGNACADRLFTGMGRVTTGTSPSDFGFGDFDGDGTTDLISMDYTDSGYTIFYNYGGGTYASKIAGSTGGTKPVRIAVDDLDNDGFADFIVSHSSTGSDNVIIHLNDGDGTFTTTPKTAVSNPSDIATGDLDNDGDVDFVVANARSEDGTNDNLSVYLNDATGIFTKVTATTFTTGDHPQGIVITDFNGDSIGDIAVGNEGSTSTTVTVFLGSSTGADNYSYSSRTTPSVGINTRGVNAGDVDGDGDNDLLAVSPYTDSVYVLVNTAGVIAGAASAGTDTVGEYPTNVATGDLDGDGIDDVVTADYNIGVDASLGTISVLFGSGSAADYLSSAVSYDAPGLPWNVLINDMDGDGNLDVMTVSEMDDTLKVFPGAGDGTLDDAYATATTSEDIDAPQALFTGSYEDSGGDGKPDIVTAEQATDKIVVVRSNGDGSFATPMEISMSSTPGSHEPVKAVMYDFNDDSSGHMDFATANYGAGNVTVVNNTGGGFTTTDYSTGAGPSDIVVSDLDNNDDEDIVVVNRNADTISVLLGDSATTTSFAAAVNYAVGDAPRRAMITDLNGDGKDDIVVTNSGSDSIAVLMGNGDGTLAAAVFYAVGDEPISLALGDLNADGNDDAVVGNYAGDSVSVLLGNGDGSFDAKVDSSIGEGPYDVALADLHGDGGADIVVVNYGDDADDAGSVSILFGDDSGTYTENYRSLVSDSAMALLVVDLDQDDFVDLVIADNADDTLDFYFNTMQ